MLLDSKVVKIKTKIIISRFINLNPWHTLLYLGLWATDVPASIGVKVNLLICTRPVILILIDLKYQQVSLSKFLLFLKSLKIASQSLNIWPEYKPMQSTDMWGRVKFMQISFSPLPRPLVSRLTF
jgi:hypothetical protein